MELKETTKRRAALEERLRRMRDLELGDLHRAEDVTRREAINAELSALTPAPILDLDQAQAVLEDCTIFWDTRGRPHGQTPVPQPHRHLRERLARPRPRRRSPAQASFLPFFQRDRRAQPRETAGVKYGSDGGRTLSVHRIGVRL